MLNSTGVAAETPMMVVLGSLFGILTVAFIGLLVWGGLLKGGKETPLARRMLIAFGGYILVFVALFWTYSRYIFDPFGSGTFGGFPVTTAWLMYGVWFFPLVFVWLYASMFNKWVLDAEDIKRFDQLIKQGENKEAGR